MAQKTGITDELGYMGKYVRGYSPHFANPHRILNDVFGPPSSQLYMPAAIVLQQKMIPDVSFWQGAINFQMMRQKTDALIIRAGQNTWVDSQFRDNWRLSKQHGILRGSYWFYDDRKSPGQQAEIWADLLHDDLPEMEIYIDWESSYGGSYGGLRNVVACMEAVERFLPTVEIGMYTGYWWFREHSNAVTNASQYEYLRRKKLFEAFYTLNAANVLIPNPWTSIYLWQFGTPPVGHEYGVETAEIDMSFINMTEAEFQQKYTGVVTPPPPTGETMPEYRVRSDFYNMTLRPEHNTGVLGTESVPAGMEMIADDIWTATADLYRVINGVNTKVNAVGDKWAHVIRVGIQIKNSWVAIIHKGVTYCNFVEPIPTEPTVKRVVKAVVHFDDNTTEELFPQ